MKRSAILVVALAVAAGGLPADECVIHGITLDEKENKVHIEWNTVTNRFVIEKGRHLGELKDHGGDCVGTSTNAHENSKDVDASPDDGAVFYRVILGRQAIDIPDTNFLHAVMDTLGTNKLAPTNRVYDTEAAKVTQMNAYMPGYPTNMSIYGVTNATGVEWFTGLTNLWIDGRGTNYGRQIGSLDVSACTNLQRLSFYGHLATNLVLPAVGRLAYLDCGFNDLVSVGPVPPTMKTFSCRYNPRFATPDLSACSNMEGVTMNDTQVSELNLPRCPLLWQLFLSNTRLSGIDLTRFPSLAQLTLWNTQVSSLDFSACTQYLWTVNVAQTPIASLDIANKPRLYNLFCGGGGPACFGRYPLSSLNVTNCPKLAAIWCGWSDLTALDLTGLTNLVQLGVTDNRLSSLVLPPVTRWSTMQVHCQGNQLTNLDLRAATGLSILNCQTNLLTEIDISSNTNCKTVRAVCNPLATIKVWWASATNAPAGLVLTYDGNPAIVYKP